VQPFLKSPFGKGGGWSEAEDGGFLKIPPPRGLGLSLLQREN